MKRPSTKPMSMTVSDAHALADRLEMLGTNRTMRDQEGLQQDLRRAAKAIRELLRDRAPGDQIVSDALWSSAPSLRWRRSRVRTCAAFDWKRLR